MKNAISFQHPFEGEFGITELTEEQMADIDGGAYWILVGLAWVLVGYVVGEVIEGVIDGIRRPH